MLNLTNPTIQDAGVYKAVASNRVGTCQSEIHVNILPVEGGHRFVEVTPFKEGPPFFAKPLR